MLRDERGVGAVELGLILPGLLGVYLGLLHYAERITVQTKVSRAAATLAALAAGTSEISDAQMAAMMNAARAVLDPADGTVALVLSSVAAQEEGASVRWSDASGAAPLERGALFVFEGDAAGLARAGKVVLVAEAALTHPSRLALAWNAFAPAPLHAAPVTVFRDRVHAFPLPVTAGAEADAPPAAVAPARVLGSGEVLQ